MACVLAGQALSDPGADLLAPKLSRAGLRALRAAETPPAAQLREALAKVTELPTTSRRPACLPIRLACLSATCNAASLARFFFFWRVHFVSLTFLFCIYDFVLSRSLSRVRGPFVICYLTQAKAQQFWDRASPSAGSADPGRVLGHFTVDGLDERTQAFVDAARLLRDEADWE